ncbi:MAG TPA: response regulator transcription factor [Terriglobales bacterium]|nr:response regulator transcription factor [Terriglobales bacterium]
MPSFRMVRILIIDDDVGLCEVLAERLESEGFSLEAAHDGVSGLERARSAEYALVVLDLMLPGLPGLDVLRSLRRHSGIPVLILTARGEDVERILGLELGADDYLAKPFNPRELIARIRAILRRSTAPGTTGRHLIAGDISLDLAAREAWINNEKLHLTSAEFSLLEAFVRDAGHVVTREHLTETALGRKVVGPFDRVIDVHVSNLRKKLGDSPAGERIKAVRGEGYQFVARSETKRR